MRVLAEVFGYIDEKDDIVVEKTVYDEAFFDGACDEAIRIYEELLKVKERERATGERDDRQ